MSESVMVSRDHRPPPGTPGSASSARGAPGGGTTAFSCNRCRKPLNTTVFVCACDCAFCEGEFQLWSNHIEQRIHVVMSWVPVAATKSSSLCADPSPAEPFLFARLSTLISSRYEQTARIIISIRVPTAQSAIRSYPRETLWNS